MRDILLVVLYQETITSSTTISSLLNDNLLNESILLILWDNSPIMMLQQELEILDRNNVSYKYIHCSENKSLSKVYNEVIDTYYSMVDKIYIFDQDSIINDRYFRLVEEAFNENKDIGLFLPYVEQGGRVISPSEYRPVINFNIYSQKQLGKVKAKNKVAFGSGVCVRATIFKNQKLRFDEELDFYGVDYKFVLDYGDLYDFFFVFDFHLEHNLSFMNYEEVEIKKRRFNSNCYAYLYLANSRLSSLYKIISIIRLFFDTLNATFKYKSIEFIKIFWTNLKLF